MGILGWGGPSQDRRALWPEGRDTSHLAARVLVGVTPWTNSLFNSLLLTHQQEWGAAPLRLAASPGAGPASPWGSESMPGGPRADRSPSTVGEHHQAGKEIEIQVEKDGGQVERIQAYGWKSVGLRTQNRLS